MFSISIHSWHEGVEACFESKEEEDLLCVVTVDPSTMALGPIPMAVQRSRRS